MGRCETFLPGLQGDKIDGSSSIEGSDECVESGTCHHEM